MIRKKASRSSTPSRKAAPTKKPRPYQAKSAEELEKKHPEAFKLYQKYLGNQAGTITVINGAMLAPGAQGQGVPMPFPMPAGGAGGIQVFQAQAVAIPAAGALPIETATEALGQLSKDIKSAAESGAWKDASKESKAALKKQAAAMQKRLADLEKQIEEK